MISFRKKGASAAGWPERNGATVVKKTMNIRFQTIFAVCLVIVMMLFAGCSGSRGTTEQGGSTEITASQPGDAAPAPATAPAPGSGSAPAPAPGSGSTPAPGAEKHRSAFYHDTDAHLMIRIGDDHISRYAAFLEEHPFQAYRFYLEEILGLETAFDRMVYTVADLNATGDQIALIDRPVPVYPEKKPMFSRILIVEVSMVVGPDGRVEFAELANIRRNSNEKESLTSTAITGEVPRWTSSGVHVLDHPYIINSLENALGYRFEPVVLNGEPVRFNVIVSYLYDADRM